MVDARVELVEAVVLPRGPPTFMPMTGPPVADV
jgi:hypothetical protein